MTDKINDEHLKEISDDLERYSEIEIFSKTKGGARLIKTLESDVIGAIDELCRKYKELSHIELLGVIIKLKERLDLCRTLRRAAGQKDGAKKAYDIRLKELLG